MARDDKENQEFWCFTNSLILKMMSGEMLFKHFKVLVVLVILWLKLKPGLGLFSNSSVGKVVRCIERERQALLQFKEGVIDDYGVLSSWGNSTDEKKDCCTWRGVRCSNITGYVIVLDLHAYSPSQNSLVVAYHSLRGKISRSLLELQHLKYLDLSYNDFTENPIPEFIGSFSRLQYLDLSDNYFVGTIPNQFGNLSELRSLDLGNNFGVSVKSLEWVSHLSFLRYLDLTQVNLSNAIDWMEATNKLPLLTELHLSVCHLISPQLPLINSSSLSLAVLDLSANSFNSSIYSWLFNFNTTLVHVDLSDNNLQGLIPDSFGNLNSLAYLDLTLNQLEGGIPKSIGNCTSLQILNLAWNQLGGSLPHSITRLSSLQELVLYGNQLNGSLPDLKGLSSLRELDLSSNSLTGPLPKSTGQLFMLEKLDVSSNSLQGTISETHLSNLNNLKELYLSDNFLSLDFSYDWNPPFQLDLIYLRSCQLGPRFPNWLLTQNNYYRLDISNSGISDIVPMEFWNFSPKRYYINLSSNHMNGMVPDLTSLKTVFYPIIDLSYNRFECPIPLFPPNVTVLNLSKNMFSGSVSFLCNITNGRLYFLDLSNNRLSGELPDCWLHMDNLLILNLANNNFSGKIPSSMGFLSQIQTLHLRNNNFTGELPSSLKNCSHLEIIDMGENKLSGKIPAWIGTNLTSLIILSLRLNKLHGHIPPEICHLNSIQILDLSQNNISGIIPPCFNKFFALVWRNKSSGNIAHDYNAYTGSYDGFGNVYVDNALVLWKGKESEYKNILALMGGIDLSGNRLVGKIPEEISSLAELNYLNLSKNELNGHVIQNIGKLKMLESLDLSRNRLSGEIPTGITRLNFLAVLDLSNNNLSGKIPSSTQLQSFDASAYFGNDELCGLPLPNKCPGDETALEPSVDKDDIIQGNEDGFINREFYVSMGLGFGVGFGGVFGTLLLNRSWEHVFFKFLNNIKDQIYVTTVVKMAKLRRRPQI
ncbi:receptor-like protein EIX2 [Cornus florida]|uniref:receptor-like protein EIX2 n=1 Tax=Cornus florida TaxID=4283 RepID=UPI00289E4D50|nr:receptor-like protein EIX2 [Cornus florida]XP_059629122.1 receptor-like protein EIX2 [Cornus florida]